MSTFFIDCAALIHSRVTVSYGAGQTRMYTFLYPYMGIVYTHVTMYIHNVRVTARVMYMYMTKTITTVYGHCIDTSQTSTTLHTRTCLYTLYTMLTIVRGCTCTIMPTSEHTLIHNQYHIHIW